MANNFKNAVVRNVSADSTLPTVIYSVPNNKKSIAIELDVSNKSSAGVNVTVQIEDESLNETKNQVGTVTASDNHIISSVAVLSKLPVGSSASRISGLLTKALAMATRCCWPPDNCVGLW